MSKLITKKLDQEQQKLELALKDKLIEDPSRKNFQEAYDQLHTFFIEQKKSEYLYSEKLDWFSEIFVELSGSGNNVLDIGCGNGKLAIEMARKGNSVIGLDISRIAIQSSKDRLDKIAPEFKIDFKEGDARKLPFEDNSFDFITSHDLVEHISEDDFKKHLAEVKRVLNSKGSYVFWTPSRLRGGSSLGLHLKEYTIYEMDKIIRQAGFKYTWFDLRFYRIKLKVKINQSIMFPVIYYEKFLSAVIRYIPERINKILVPRLLFQLKK